MEHEIKNFRISDQTMQYLSLAWERDPEVSGYIIEKLQGKEWEHVVLIGDNMITSCKVYDLKPYIKYYFRIRTFILGDSGNMLHGVASQIEAQVKSLKRISNLMKTASGEWVYVKDGKRDKNFTGLVQAPSGKCRYVKQGKIDWTFTGIAQAPSAKWYYVNRGALDWSYSGVINLPNGKIYEVNNGVIIKEKKS